MNQRILIFLQFFSLVGLAQSPMVLEGTYQGHNLYIQNPLRPDTNRFCVDSVYINNKNYPFKNTSAFELDFDS